MPVLRKTINLTVSGNTLISTDSVTMLSTTDAGVQGENEAVMLHVAVPVDWQTLTVRLRVISESGSYDESLDAVANVIDMPIKQGMTVPGHITVSLLGLQLISTGNYAIRKTADCKSLVIKESKIPIDVIPLLYPQVFEALKSEVQTQTVHTITGAGAAIVSRVGNAVTVNFQGGGGGDMLQANYANGLGSANTNKVDHAMSADTAPTQVAGDNSIKIANTAYVDKGASSAYAGSTLESILKTGWNGLAQTLTFLSAIDTPTFTATTSADLTGVISVGMRIKLAQTTTKYFIVTAITATTITLYGGTDYSLISAAISNVYYSLVKAPFGFPLDPEKWSVYVLDTSIRTQSNPSTNTYYNIQSLSISVPIGMWNLEFEAQVDISITSTSNLNCSIGLSTSASSFSDLRLKLAIWAYIVSGDVMSFAQRNKPLSLISKTTYYLIETTGSSGLYSISLRGDYATTVLRAVCAYL
jgi:hypothetical protein